MLDSEGLDILQRDENEIPSTHTGFDLVREAAA
jgi:hypothetical protein